MAPAAFGMTRLDDLLRAAQAAGHAFAPVDDGPDCGPIASSRRFLTWSTISLSGLVASCGAFAMLG